MQNQNCIFCKIVGKKIHATIVFETSHVVAFRDLSPVAPTHILIIPKEHIASVNDIDESQTMVIGEILFVAKKVAEQETLSERGYRLVFNCNQDACQTVFHLHCHLIGGVKMGWPPFPPFIHI